MWISQRPKWKMVSRFPLLPWRRVAFIYFKHRWPLFPLNKCKAGRFVAFLLEKYWNLDLWLQTWILSYFVTFYKIWVAHCVKQSNSWASDGQGPAACALEEETEGHGFVQPWGDDFAGDYCSLPLSMGKLIKRCSQLQGKGLQTGVGFSEKILK